MRICFYLVLFAGMPAWAQVTASAIDDPTMKVPPPVTGQAYSTELGSEARTNYLHVGFLVTMAYNDNVLAGTSTNPIGDASYLIAPMIALDQTNSRLHQTIVYSPGFTFYQKTSSLNEADQNLVLDFNYRLTPHMTASFQDTFRKSSNVFNQFGPLAGGSISGSAQSPFVPVVVPIADQLTNSANAELTYQFTRNGMIGGSGTFMNLHYPDPSQVPGLADSNSRGGAAFFSSRLYKTQYLGVTYQYSDFLGNSFGTQNESQGQPDSETRTNAILLFYTDYLTPHLSFSVSGGPQHFDVSDSQSGSTSSWAPAVTASMGWHGSHTSLVASYAQTVSGGGGLIGAYHSDGANAAARWHFARTWTAGTTATYSLTKNVDSSMAVSNPGGHLISGTVMAEHTISDRFRVEFGYTHLHQNYDYIAAVSNAPDSNRGYVSISYQLTGPLGR